jgi:hypothetical protein
MTGVRAAQFNASSGSVLIEYEPGIVDPNVLIEAAAAAAELDPPCDHERRGPRREPALRLIAAARRFNTSTRSLTGGQVDLRVLVPIALGAVSAYSLISRKDRLPRWESLAYWAFAIFQTLHATEIAERDDHAT